MINNPFILIENELKNVDDILEKQLENYKEERADISQKLQEKNINIMFFGAYNAGKSTLINTLLKEKKAIVGDIPTTDTIDTYLWNDYKLLDTPGINAPIEHENISKEQLEKSDLIVFVIRKDDEDASSTYKEIFDLLKKEKDIFLVFNYSGLDKNTIGEGGVQLSIDRLNKIMLLEAKRHDIDDELLKTINLIPINLKTALKARLENKEKLLEHANYLEFEERFTLWLNQYNSEHQILKTLKSQIDKQLLSPVINRLEINQSELSVLVENLKLLISEKENLKMEIDRFIQNQISILLPKVIELLENDNQQSIKNELSKVYEKIETHLSGILKESISTIERESLELNLIVPKKEGSNFDPKLLLPLIATIPMPPQIKIIVTAIITITTTLFGGNDTETEMENERRREKALQISQATQDIKSKILSSILKQSKEIIEKTFEKNINVINQKIKSEKENINRENHIKTLLKETRVKISGINF